MSSVLLSTHVAGVPIKRLVPIGRSPQVVGIQLDLRSNWDGERALTADSDQDKTTSYRGAKITLSLFLSSFVAAHACHAPSGGCNISRRRLSSTPPRSILKPATRTGVGSAYPASLSQSEYVYCFAKLMRGEGSAIEGRFSSRRVYVSQVPPPGRMVCCAGPQRGGGRTGKCSVQVVDEMRCRA